MKKNKWVKPINFIQVVGSKGKNMLFATFLSVRPHVFFSEKSN